MSGRGARAVTMTLVRVAGSLVLACAVVFAMLALGLRFMQRLEGDGERVAHPVAWLSPGELAALLGEDGRPRRSLPQLADIPAFELPRREATGFVQLSFTVQPDGRVSDVEVLGATPPGYFEEQALALVRARRYAPSFVDGRAVPTQRTEIIDFKVASPPGTER